MTMPLIETLEEDLYTARKAKDKFKTVVLSTIVGNLKSNAKLVDGKKVVSDEDAVAYIKKHVKGLRETANYSFSDELAVELALVEGYLPVQLTRAALEGLLSQLRATESVAAMKDWMSYLKTNYAGLYDGKLATEVFNA